MKRAFLIGCALALLSGPALAQYGGGGQNSGGPLGSYVRNWGGYNGSAEVYGTDEMQPGVSECRIVTRRAIDRSGRPYLRQVQVCE